MASNDNEGFRNISPIPRATTMIEKSNLANSMPPETQTGIFNNLTVGVINHVFKVTEQGMWLGAEQFGDAPFSVTMDGVVTIGGYLSDAYLREGQAANDINTYATTISGAKITTGTITANKLSVTTLSSITANLGTINSGTINSITMNGSTVNTTTLNSSTINSTVINGGTINSATLNSVAINTSTLTSNSISGGSITSTSLSSSSISATTITGGSISSTTMSSSTITSGTITSSVIVIPTESGGATGYLRWTSGSRIWSDSSGNMGYRATGGGHYFYGASAQAAVISVSGQARFDYGVRSVGNFNGEANGAMSGYFNVGSTLTVYGRATLAGALNLSGGTTYISSHINATPNKTYNLGSSSSAWNYVNARGFSTVSMASFDSPVLMPDGREVDDIEALKSIKERPDGITEPNGRPTLDKRTFPDDVRVKAYDSKTGKEYPRDKKGDPIVNGKVMPEADGIDLVQFTSLLFGAFKQLNAKVEKLEQQSNKNVKI